MSHQVVLGTSPVFNQILNYQQGQSRLKELPPGTEEYSKLEAALRKTSSIAEVSLPDGEYKVATFSREKQLLGGFGSAEHVAIGKKVVLKGLPDNDPALLVKGNNRLQFSHIVALAGDFYGVVNQAISLPGGSDEEKTIRFQNAFGTLEQADNHQLRRILLEIDRECSAMENASLPHHCYSSGLMGRTHVIEKIKNDIGDLLVDNSDHFSENAQDAYRIGHNYAISIAREAGRIAKTASSEADQKKALEELKKAYALDAFACHFLTDLFSSGHSRNQRGLLEVFLVQQLNFSKIRAKQLAGVLTAAQHQKDGDEGLNVSNENGDHWRAFGDGLFFVPKNKENSERVVAATQQSVDEIYAAYETPDHEQLSSVERLIPRATPLNPLPIYSVSQDGTSLCLHLPGGDKEITTKTGYLTDGLQQALRYLPEEYINGYLKKLIIPGECETPVVLSHVIIPQIERLTSPIWHLIGLATYLQVKQTNQQLNAKIDELADILKSTYDNTVKILEQIELVKGKLNLIAFDTKFKEISESISKIKDLQFQYKEHPSTFDKGTLNRAADTLVDAYIRLSRVFSENTEMLTAYETMLKDTRIPDSEVRMSVTLWFRQMIDCQVQAFCLRETFLQIGENENTRIDQMRAELKEFERTLEKQIQANKELISEDLIYESQDYIRLQIQKVRTRQEAHRILSIEEA